jgi:hypothetical protein
MACDVPFEGAEGNLQRLFEKNQKRFTDLKTDSGKQSNTPKEQWYVCYIGHDTLMSLIHFKAYKHMTLLLIIQFKGYHLYIGNGDQQNILML